MARRNLHEEMKRQEKIYIYGARTTYRIYELWDNSMFVTCLRTGQQGLQTTPKTETTDVTSQAAKQNLLLKQKPLRVSVLVLSQACHHVRP